jgi:hypothetical protein
MDYVAPPTGEDVAAFLGRSSDPAFVTLCGNHVSLVAKFVEGYTRGQGFDSDGWMVEDIRAAVITATARLVTNPAQVEREGADAYYAVGAFNGFSLPELAVLHHYRRRTA